MEQPLVSVICLCYNQGPFIEDAIASVAWQRYPHVECIAINDASQDASFEILEKLKLQYPWLKVVHNLTNLGMCASFNLGLSLSKGKYLIDLASDDVMHPDRIAKQVHRMLQTKAAVCYSDAWIMNEEGMVHSRFYEPSQFPLPEGNLFPRLLKSYFICSPTIMIERELMERIGGYDAGLAFEDYDFFIRSSSISSYCAIEEPLTFRREVSGSNSSKWYSPYQNPHLESTWVILDRTFPLLKTEEEKASWSFSTRYHWRQSALLQIRGPLISKYFSLLKKMPLKWSDRWLYWVFKIPMPWARLYNMYRLTRFKRKKPSSGELLTYYKSMI